jgi:hypothetical protein
MGALSSWAILAVTHHVIVQLAAYRAGWKGWYPLYALLGDDIVILREDVAREYLSLMRYLGVTINISKSISSSNGLLEFAKRVVSARHGDLSPISGRLLVSAVRNPAGWLEVWTHILDFGYILFPNQLLRVMANLSSDLNRKPFTAFKDLEIGQAVIARVFILSRLREGVVLRPRFVDEWYHAILGNAKWGLFLEEEAKLLEIRKIFQSGHLEYRRAQKELITFTKQWWRYALFSGSLGGVLSIPLLMLSPAYWVSLSTRVQAVWKLWSFNMSTMLTMEPMATGDLVRGTVDSWEVPEVNIPQMELRKVTRPDVKTSLAFWLTAYRSAIYSGSTDLRREVTKASKTDVVVSGLLAAPSSPR